VSSYLIDNFLVYYWQLPAQIRNQARKVDRLWRQNPHHPSLCFKRAHTTEPIYAVRVGRGWRVLGLREGRPSTGFGSVRTPTMIASYPSGRSTTGFHSNLPKDVVRCVGRGAYEGPDENSDSGALPLPNEGLEPTPYSLCCAPAFGHSSGPAFGMTSTGVAGGTPVTAVMSKRAFEFPIRAISASRLWTLRGCIT
jgi:hypothetical protein